MNHSDDAGNQNNENIGINLITLGSIITRIGDVVSSITSTFDQDEITNVENQQDLEELERELQILLNEMKDFTKKY